MKLATKQTVGPTMVDLGPALRKYGGLQFEGEILIAIHNDDERWPALVAALETLTDIAEKAEAGQPQQAVSVPDGWRLVPDEPTEAMKNAAWEYFSLSTTTALQFPDAARCYRAMLAAAPEPPK